MEGASAEDDEQKAGIHSQPKISFGTVISFSYFNVSTWHGLEALGNFPR